MEHYNAGKYLPSNMKGSEREIIIYEYLAKILPPTLRFSSGAIIDNEKSSGQVDIVIETPFDISFPLPASSKKMFIAESVGGVIEVKSDIGKQWNQFIKTVSKVKKINRDIKLIESYGEIPKKIPIYGIGFHGPKKLITLKNKIEKIEKDLRPDAVLIIESGNMISMEHEERGSAGLFLFISQILKEVLKISEAIPNTEKYL
jgi:hypothetical protein